VPLSTRIFVSDFLPERCENNQAVWMLFLLLLILLPAHVTLLSDLRMHLIRCVTVCRRTWVRSIPDHASDSVRNALSPIVLEISSGPSEVGCIHRLHRPDEISSSHACESSLNCHNFSAVSTMGLSGFVQVVGFPDKLCCITTAA